MTKQFYSPADEAILDRMMAYFGSQFQNMNPTEKCWLLYRIGFHLWMVDAEAEQVSEPVEEALACIENELSVSARLRLAEAIVNQLQQHLSRG